MKRSCQFQFIALMLAGFWLLVAGMSVSCKKETQSGISGRVSVEGGSAAGVTVELFEDNPGWDNKSVWAHPSSQDARVGMPYSPQVAFDWRGSIERQHLRATVSTGSDGAFKFSDVAEGDYVIVARKDSFGWSRPIAARPRGNSLEVGTLRLFRENHLGQNPIIESETRWTAGRHYVIANGGTLTISEGAKLTIERGAVVRIGFDGRIRVFGQLVAEGSPDSLVVFTSDARDNPSILDWQSVFFNRDARAPHFRYCRFEYCSDAIRSVAPGGRIEHCFFHRILSQCADLTGDSTVTADSTVFRYNVADRVPLVLRLSEIWREGFSIDHNVMHRAVNYGVQLERSRGGLVYCNWFSGCGQADSVAGPPTGAMFLSHLFRININHNFFDRGWFSLSVGSRVDSSVLIDFNKFDRPATVLNIGVTEGDLGPSNPTFRNNCMNTVLHGMVMLNSCVINNLVLDCSNNYWGTQSDAGVRSMINDCEDDVRCRCVIYQPFLLSCPDNVGLCEP